MDSAKENTGKMKKDDSPGMVSCTWEWRQEECEFEGSLHIGDAVSKSKQDKVKTKEARERTVVHGFSEFRVKNKSQKEVS